MILHFFFWLAIENANNSENNCIQLDLEQNKIKSLLIIQNFVIPLRLN